MMLLAASRRQWKRAAAHARHLRRGHRGAVRANAAITGEFNYQGGDRKTFYSYTGFPFANTWETFDNIGSRARPRGSAGRRCAREHALGHRAPPQPLVFPRRPQRRALFRISFPACSPSRCSCSRSRSISGNGSRLRTIAVVVVMHVFVWPFTWNGGGGPVGSRYFLPFYALFLVLIPATAGAGRGDRRVRRRRAVYRAARAESVLRLAASRASTRNRARCGCCRSN